MAKGMDKRKEVKKPKKSKEAKKAEAELARIKGNK
jgi:hypothetical protein